AGSVGPRAVSRRSGRRGIQQGSDLRRGPARRYRAELSGSHARAANVGLAFDRGARGRVAGGRGARQGLSAPALVILAAGVGSRFGGPKQLSPVGPSGETLLDYAIYDAMRAGFTHAVLVIRKELAAPLREHVSEVTRGVVPVQYVEQRVPEGRAKPWGTAHRSEEHTSELQSRVDLVCR